MLNIGELMLIIAIVVIVFGMGKLSTLGTNLSQAAKGFKEGLGDGMTGEESRDVIDITPADGGAVLREAGHKPGTKSQPIEDAEIESAD